MKRILLAGAQAVLPESVQDMDLVIAGDRIELLGATQIYDEIINAANLFILPGLVDIHYHGLFILPSPEKISRELQRMQNLLAQNGVAGFLATFPAMDVSKLCECLLALKEAAKAPAENGASLLGVHLEGPFLSLEAKGAQPEKSIVEFEPDSAAMLKIFEAGEGLVKIMTFAPEQKHARELVRLLAARKIIPSLGHSAVSYEQAMEFAELGASGITHLFNAMSGLHHRSPGMALAGLDGRFYKEMIVDGFHVHPAMVRLAWENTPPGKFILVSDMVGDEEPLDFEPPRLGTGGFAGSRLRLLRAVRNLMKFSGAKLHEAVAAASLWPAELLGKGGLGRLAAGAEANLLLCDQNLRLKQVMLRGSFLPEARDV